jgi:hypothetical protein
MGYEKMSLKLAYEVRRRRSSQFARTVLKDGVVVSLKRLLPFTLREIHGTHFCQRLFRAECHVVAGRSRSNEKSSYLIGN